jgi:hypothetical protein
VKRTTLVVLFSGGDAGGAADQLESLLAGLNRHRFERFAFVPGPGRLAEELRATGVEVGILPGLAPEAPLASMLWACVRMVFARGFDLIQAEGTRALVPAALRRLFRGGRLVWVLRRPPRAPGWNRWMRWLGGLADRILCAGELFPERLPERWKRRAARIEDGLELPRPRGPAKPGGPWLIGPLSPELDLDAALLLIQAVRVLALKLADLKLGVAGPSVFRRAAELQARAIEQPDRLVELADPLEVDVAVVDADRSSRPRALASALAAGLPVIAIGGQWAEGAVARVPRHDLAAMVGTLVELKDPARAQQLGEAGRRFAEEQLSRARRVERFERLYDELITAR